jgi:hypothetical protein
VNLPESVRIAGVEWAVVREPDLSAGRQMTGEMRPMQQALAIDSNLPPGIASETLMHEIIEAIVKHYGIEDMCHQTLSTISAALHDVLVHNEDLNFR